MKRKFLILLLLMAALAAATALPVLERTAQPPDPGPAEPASDRLGLALSLFTQGRPAEAAPLAEEAWQARRKALGPAAPATLSAATRLATIYVALNETARAEALLQEVFALAGADDAARAEAELLLNALNQQSGRQAGFSGASGAFGETTLQTAAPLKVTPEQVAEWNRLAEGLAGHNDVLAAELRARSIAGRAALEGLNLGPSGPRPLRLALARAWAAAGRFDRAEELLRTLSAEIQPSETADFIEYASLLADSLEGTGRAAEAESARRAAAEAAEAFVYAAPTVDPAAVDRSLLLSLKLAENFARQGKVAPEVEIELRSALARMAEAGIKNVDLYPAAGRIYLRLATLVGSKRAAERDTYYRRARGVAEALLTQTSDPAAQRELRDITAQADSGLAADRRKTAGTAPPETPLPEAYLLRQELAALVSLGRPEEFQARLAPLLAEAARRFGPVSQPYMRYYSLKLKGWEETGRVEELTAELTAQADNPPGRTEAEQNLNRSNALFYAATVNEQAGRDDAAIALYQGALAALKEFHNPAAIERRRLMQVSLDALVKKVHNEAE